MPAMAARLPRRGVRGGGQTVENTCQPSTVREWLDERIARSRVYK